MGKHDHLSHDELPMPRRRRRYSRTIIALLILAALTPLAIDCAAICLANWRAFMGMSADARTPCIDWIRDNVADLRQDVHNLISPYFGHLPWRPEYVLPVGAAVMVISMLLLGR